MAEAYRVAEVPFIIKNINSLVRGDHGDSEVVVLQSSQAVCLHL